MNNYIIIGIVISEILALLLIRKVWKSHDPTIMKVIVSIIALIPFFGLFFVAWVYNFPASNPPDKQVHGKGFFFFEHMEAERAARKNKEKLKKQKKYS